MLTAKVAVAATAIFAVGGVAAVAATGHLTSPTGRSPVVSATSRHPADHSMSRTATAMARATGDRAVPSPSLLGLCHAYTAGAGSEHGKALDNPAFTALITAAGDKTKVDGYGTTLFNQDAAAGAGSTTKNAAPGRSSSGHQASTDHPTGPPSPHPTGPPSTHPTGHHSP